MSESKRSSGYYARIMGTFWRHPRTSGLSLAARGLWVSLLSWCADQRSDGEVPAHVVQMVSAGDKRANLHKLELERAGLLTSLRANTLQLRDWAQHNITRADHDREKERARNGMANKRATAQPVTRNRGVASPPGYASVSDQDQDQDQDQSLPSGRDSDARAPAPAPDLPPSASATFDRRCEEVRKALSAAVTEVRKGPLPPALSLGTAPSREVSDIARWLATADGVDLGAMARRWAASRQKTGAWVPLSWLARDPTEWASEPPSASAVRLTPEQDQASIEDLMRAGGAM